MDYDIRDEHRTYKHHVDESPMSSNHFKLHFHPDYELLYFIHGDAKYVIEDTCYDLSPHSLLVIKPGQYHNVIFNSNELYERIVIRFNNHDIPNCIKEKFQQLSPLYNIAGTSLSKTLFHFDIYTQEVTQQEMLIELLRSSIAGILIYLCTQDLSTEFSRYNNHLIGEILTFIDLNLVSIQRLEDICDSLHLARSTVNRLFDYQMGTSIMSYVRTKKCMLARTMLHSGILPTVASERCGFNDYSSFYRAYTKVFQTSPKTDKSLAHNPLVADRTRTY